MMCLMGVTFTNNRVLTIQFLAPVTYNCIIFLLTLYRILVSCKPIPILQSYQGC